MVKKDPFFRPQIDRTIEEKLKVVKKEQRYEGSMASFVKTILVKYVDGLLEESSDVKEVHAVRARRVSVNEQRKSA